MIFNFILISHFVVLTFAYDENHEHFGAAVEDTIKRYSREANVEIDQIKQKLFKRVSVGSHSLNTSSKSTKFK